MYLPTVDLVGICLAALRKWVSRRQKIPVKAERRRIRQACPRHWPLRQMVAVERGQHGLLPAQIVRHTHQSATGRARTLYGPECVLPRSSVRQIQSGRYGRSRHRCAPRRWRQTDRWRRWSSRTAGDSVRRYRLRPRAGTRCRAACCPMHANWCRRRQCTRQGARYRPHPNHYLSGTAFRPASRWSASC